MSYDLVILLNKYEDAIIEHTKNPTTNAWSKMVRTRINFLNALFGGKIPEPSTEDVIAWALLRGKMGHDGMFWHFYPGDEYTGKRYTFQCNMPPSIEQEFREEMKKEREKKP